MLHQHEVLGIERPLAPGEARGLTVGNSVSRSRRIVCLVVTRNPTKLEQCALHSLAQRRHRLRQTHGRPLPIRVGQHEHAQQVREQLASDRDRELGRAREVGLRRLAGAMQLRQRNQLLGSACSTPLPHASLQRTQLPVLVSLGMLLLQQLEQRLGLELGRQREPRLDLRPVLHKRICPRPPLAWRHQL